MPDIWGAVTEFFTGGGDAAGVAGEVAEGAANWDVAGFVGGLFESAPEGAAPGLIDEASDLIGDDGAAQGVADKLIDGAEKAGDSDAEKLLGNFDMGHGASGTEPFTGGDAGKKESLLAKLGDWFGSLDKDEKTMATTIFGSALAGIGGAAKQYMKAGDDKERMLLASELAGKTEGERRAAYLAATQAANQVPVGVPFKPKPGAVLTNRAGQSVQLPQVGLIQGAMQ